MSHKVSIYDTVSPHVKLKKIGKNYQGLCPFHAEKTPSFTVYPQNNNYHCFGCGAHGDAITFEMTYYGLTYPQACDKLGLERDHSHSHPPPNPSHFQPKSPRLPLIDEAKELENQKRNRDREIRLHKNTPKGEKSPLLEPRQVADVACDYRVFIEPYGRFSGVKCTAFLLTNLNGKNPRGLQKLYHIKGKNYKKFTYGLKLKGACHLLKPDEITDQTVLMIIICEGIMTGLSLKKAFPNAWIYCALTASNLPTLAKQIRQKDPNALIYIACDNDENGTGLKYGEEAAYQSQGRLVIPNEIGEDFNDVLVKQGVDGLKKYFVKNELDWPKILRGETSPEKRLGTPSIIHYISKDYPRLTQDDCLSSYLKNLGPQVQLSERSLQILKERASQKIRQKRRWLKKQIYDGPQNGENLTVEYLSEKYIPKDFVMRALINLLSSGMGSGKTQLMKRDAANRPPEAQLFYLAPITNLVQTSAQDLGFTYYQDDQAYQSKRVATTLHSLYKFNLEQIDTFYIDEIEQILKVIIGQAIKNPEKIFNAFCQALVQAKRLVIADAFLSQRTLNFIRHLRPHDPIQWLAPSEKRRADGPGKKLIPYWGRQGQETLIQLVINQLKLDKRVLIPTSSKKLSQRLMTLFQQQFPEKKGIVINSDTSGDHQDLILNINRQIDDYDYVIYTPSFSAGVSIDESVKPFDFIAAFIYGSVGTWPDAWQLIARYRKRLDLHVWIQNYTNHSPTDSKKVLNSYLLAQESTEKYTSTFRAHYTDKLLQAHIKGQVYHPNDFDIWYCEIEAQQNEFSKDFANNFLLLGELRGYEIAYPSKTSENISFDWTEIKNSHQSLRIENLMTANPLNSREFETLKKQPGLTERQHHQLERFVLETFYNQSLDDELIRYDNDGKRRQQIRTLELANRSDDYLIQKDREDQNTQSVVLHQNRIFKKELLAKTLEAVGLRFEADGSLSSDGRYFEIHDPHIQNVLKWVDHHREAIDGLKIGPTRQDLLTNLQWFLALLKNLGFNVTHKKVQGERYYCVVIPALHHLNKHLIQRYSRFLDRYCEELASADFWAENHENREPLEGAAHPIEFIHIGGGAPSLTENHLSLVKLIYQIHKTPLDPSRIVDLLEEHEITSHDDELWSTICEILDEFGDLRFGEKIIRYLSRQLVSFNRLTG